MNISEQTKELMSSRINTATKILSDVPAGVTASSYMLRIQDFLPDATLEVRITYKSITDPYSSRNIYLTLNSLRWCGYSIGLPAWINQFTDTYPIAENFSDSSTVDAVKAIIGDTLEIVNVCFTVKLEMYFEGHGTMVIYLDSIEDLQLGDSIRIDASNTPIDEKLISNYELLRNLLREDNNNK